MSYVSEYWDRTLVQFPFSPKPPEPEVIVQEVVREPEPPSVDLEEKVTRQEEELARLGREINLLTTLLTRQTEEAKVAALYLGRKVPNDSEAH
jgi:hypothetical protein